MKIARIVGLSRELFSDDSGFFWQGCVMRRKLAAWSVVLTALVSLPVLADMRCQQSLVRRGDLTFEVEERCGPPVRAHSRVEFMYPYRPVQVDEWVYEFGTNRFRRLLRFENGRLMRIDLLRKPERSATGDWRKR